MCADLRRDGVEGKEGEGETGSTQRCEDQGRQNIVDGLKDPRPKTWQYTPQPWTDPRYVINNNLYASPIWGVEPGEGVDNMQLMCVMYI